MNFGLSNPLSTFQNKSSHRIFLGPSCITLWLYFLMISQFIEKPKKDVKHVDKSLQLLQDNQLFLKQFKCTFDTFEVEYLCNRVNQDKVQVDTKKIEAMWDWPCPKALKRWHDNFGITCYYKKFVKNYGWVRFPLTTPLKMNDFVWNDARKNSFSYFKRSNMLYTSLSSAWFH